MINQKQYTVKTQFVFKGLFIVNAHDKKQAREYVDKHCGLVLNRGIHSSLPDDIVDWDFPIHPEKRICRIRVNNELEH